MPADAIGLAGAEAFREQLTPTEREVYDLAGYWRHFGAGTRPGLLIVDVEYNFTGDVDEPVLDSIRKYPNSCGPAAWAAVPVIAELLGCARAGAHPVAFTHGRERGASSLPRIGNQVVDELRPYDGELVVEKAAASAFFDTGIAAWFRARGVDTIVHVGCTTSGCVRASVVDADAYGFRNLVVADGVFDRAEAPHRANLFDLHAKYADVIDSAQAADHLRSAGDAFRSG